MKEKLTAYIGVRLDENVAERVAVIAAEHGLSVSDLTRVALAETLPRWEKSGVTIKPIRKVRVTAARD